MSTMIEPRPVEAADQAPTPRSRRRRIPVRFIVFGVLAAMGPWLGNAMSEFALMCFEGFPLVVGR